MNRFAGRILLSLAASMGCLACASNLAADRNLRQVEEAPAEIAILQVEDRSPGGWAKPEQLRSALVAQAVDIGFSPLSRTFVDQAAVDLDVPEIGEAGVLRLRILTWADSMGDGSVLSVRYHATLHVKGQIVADVLQGERLVIPATQQSLSSGPRMDYLMETLAARIFQTLPPPPSF